MKSYYILPKSLIDNAKIAAINFHPGSPEYPGSGCVNWALYNGEKTTGITIHFLNEYVDNGAIIKVFKIPILPNDNIETLLPRVHMKQLGAFYDLVTTVHKYGPEILRKFVENNNKVKWGIKVGRIRDVDNLQTIDTRIPQQELDNIIRATAIGQFGPRLKLHGHEFRYYKEKK
jgi:methionyl-tRNA formyltransferase